MVRKGVKCYIPKEMKNMLERLAEGLGLSESEILRIALFELASKHNIITEVMHKSPF